MATPETLSEKAQNVVDAVHEAVSNPQKKLDALSKAIQEASEGDFTKATQVIEQTKLQLQSQASTVRETAIQTFQEKLKQLRNALPQEQQSRIDQLHDIASTVMGGIENASTSAANTVHSSLGKAQEWIANHMEKLATLPVIGPIAKMLSWSSIKQSFLSALTGLYRRPEPIDFTKKEGWLTGIASMFGSTLLRDSVLNPVGLFAHKYLMKEEMQRAVKKAQKPGDTITISEITTDDVDAMIDRRVRAASMKVANAQVLLESMTKTYINAKRAKLPAGTSLTLELTVNDILDNTTPEPIIGAPTATPGTAPATAPQAQATTTPAQSPIATPTSPAI